MRKYTFTYNTMHVYLHVSYIWGHRWNAEVELHWEGNWQSAVMKVATGVARGECEGKGAESDRIPANSFPQEPLPQ